MRALRKELLTVRADVERMELARATIELRQAVIHFSWLKFVLPGFASGTSSSFMRSSVACLLLQWTVWLVFKNYYKGLFEATYNCLARNASSFQLRRLPHRRDVLPDALVSSLCPW